MKEFLLLKQVKGFPLSVKDKDSKNLLI